MHSGGCKYAFTVCLEQSMCTITSPYHLWHCVSFSPRNIFTGKALHRGTMQSVVCKWIIWSCNKSFISRFNSLNGCMRICHIFPGNTSYAWMNCYPVFTSSRRLIFTMHCQLVQLSNYVDFLETSGALVGMSIWEVVHPALINIHSYRHIMSLQHTVRVLSV